MENLFKDQASMYIFALVYADVSIRRGILNITQELYLDKEKAKEWLKTIHSKIHNYPNLSLRLSAETQLEYLYLNMTRE